MTRRKLPQLPQPPPSNVPYDTTMAASMIEGAFEQEEFGPTLDWFEEQGDGWACQLIKDFLRITTKYNFGLGTFLRMAALCSHAHCPLNHIEPMGHWQSVTHHCSHCDYFTIKNHRKEFQILTNEEADYSCNSAIKYAANTISTALIAPFTEGLHVESIENLKASREGAMLIRNAIKKPHHDNWQQFVDTAIAHYGRAHFLSEDRTTEIRVELPFWHDNMPLFIYTQ